MRSLLPVLLFTFPFAAPLAAQDQADGAAQSGLTVRLEPASRIVHEGKPIDLRLMIECRDEAKLPAGVLAGMALEVEVGGKKRTVGKSAGSGKVTVAAGTRIERTLTMPADALAGAGGGGELLPVKISWPGLEGASTAVRLAPDLSAVAVEDLDLSQTKVLLVTNHGEMTVRFFADKAPRHVANFIKLAKDGFYDGTKFHRIIRGFMVQGGCPNTKEGATGEPGTGSPGYTVDAEFNADIKHKKGVLSMARGGNPNSAGCQFFICHGDAPWLDGQYSAFGVLDSGVDTLDRIAAVPVTASRSGEASMPLEPVHLYAAVVLPVRKK